MLNLQKFALTVDFFGIISPIVAFSNRLKVRKKLKGGVMISNQVS